MIDVDNLAELMEARLPAAMVEFLREAGRLAGQEVQKLYLVGGVVRDLLLGRDNLDLDLVVAGDAIALAGKLAALKQGKVTSHARFGTATVRWDGWRADLAMARSETYARPGALPAVQPGTIENDLFRRDFTINAMAVRLSPDAYGEVVDRYGGRADLETGLVRVLHDGSFTDDATRIWRAIRYEQRLDFQIESHTLGLLKRDVAMLDTISGDRIRHELELVLKEALPEKVLWRAHALGVLSRLHPALRGDYWLSSKFVWARELGLPEGVGVGLYLALLAYRLTAEQVEQLVASLRLPGTLAEAVRDAGALKNNLDALAQPDLPPSAIYSLLHDCSATALTANLIATDSALVKERIQLYLDKLRHVRPALTGHDLQEMGVTGLRIKEVLGRLREARLDGRVSDKRGEETLVRDWLCPP